MFAKLRLDVRNTRDSRAVFRFVVVIVGIMLLVLLGGDLSTRQAVHAQSGTTLSFGVPAEPVSLGSVIQIPIQVTGAANLAALEFDVSFDSTLLDFDSVNWSDFLTQGGRQIPADPNTGAPITLGPITTTVGVTTTVGLGRFTIEGSGAAGANGDGTLATLSFSTKGKAGTSALSFGGVILVDPDANVLPSSSTSAQLIIRAFTDQGTPSDWWYQWVNALWNAGLTAGCATNGDGTRNYCPHKELARSEMFTFLRAAKGLQPYTPPEPTFADLGPSHWAYPHIEALVQAGIIDPTNEVQQHRCGFDTQSGKPKVCPDDLAPRWQMAVFLARALGIHNQAPSAGAPHFTDVPPTHPAYQEIEALYTEGLTAGCKVNPDGTREFCPDKNLARSEKAVFLVRGFVSP